MSHGEGEGDTITVTLGFPQTDPPLASGGEVTFIPAGPDGSYYEVHTFTADGAAAGGQMEHTFQFLNDQHPDTVEVLVVGGGGGGGGAVSGVTSGSGGAGRFVYHPAFNVASTEDWNTSRTITVKVGTGGTSGTSGAGGTYQGGNGGDSVFLRHNNYQIIAPGGGGGAKNPNSANSGSEGGSGGGSHNLKSSGANDVPGTVPQGSGALNLGSPGGYGSINANNGGGAGGASPGDTTGKEPNISGTTQTYAAGAKNGSGAGANGTGNGGRGNSWGVAGTNGGIGIVIVRFPYSGGAE